MKLHAYAPVFKQSASGQAVKPREGAVDASPSRIVTFTTALDIHSLLPAVQAAGPRGIKK